MKTFFTFVLACGASAMRQSILQVQTQPVYEVENLDSVQAEIGSWYDTVARPFVENHRDLVYKAALAELELERGHLLATCEEGTKCRQENERSMKTKIEQQWKSVLTSFQRDVQASVLITKQIVEEGWDTAIQCEEDHPCCEVDERVWHNLVTQITETEKLLQQKRIQWQELERRRIEMITDCPEVDFELIEQHLIIEESIVEEEEEEIIGGWYPEFLDDQPETITTVKTVVVDEPVIELEYGMVYQCEVALESLDLVSIHSNLPYQLTFESHVDRDLTIMWLSFSGEPVFYDTLEAGTTYTVSTYVTHPWAIYDGDQLQLVEVVSDEQTPPGVHYRLDLEQGDCGVVANGVELVAPEQEVIHFDPVVTEHVSFEHGDVYQGSIAQAELDAGYIRSINSNVRYSLTFISHTTMDLGIYWIDYQGAPVFYDNLEAGTTYDVGTFVTHPWAIYLDGKLQLIEVLSDESIPPDKHYNFNLEETDLGIFATVEIG